MRRLSRPSHTARKAVELCAATLKDIDLKSRLLSVVDDIEAAEGIYKIRGVNASLHELPPEIAINNCVNKDEMAGLYKSTFARSPSTRYIYDSIRTSSKNGICPLCGHRHVATLDHYLPQSHHPIFAVTPLNLVPSCSDCNKVKSNRCPSTAEDQTFHPYFDEVNDATWLKASVIDGFPPLVRFVIAAPAGWDQVKTQRLLMHFKTFGLAELYSANAAQELAQIEYGLVRISRGSDPGGVKAHLSEQAISRSVDHPNSWGAAFYAALANSEWFCREGYKCISGRF